MPDHQTQPHKLGLKAPPNTRNSPYQIYLNSLAISGRKPMATLLNHCALILGHEGIADTFDWQSLTFEEVHRVRSTLVEMGYSVNTINMTIAGLRGVTKAAFNLGLMNADDMMRIGAIRPVKGSRTTRKGRCLSHADIQALKAVCRQESGCVRQARDLVILLVGIGAGLRCAEICALDLDDVDMDNECLTVQQGKGRKYRQIFLAPDLIQALSDWVALRGSHTGPMFTRVLRNNTLTQERLTHSGLSHALKQLQVQAKIQPFAPHDLRRTFITHLLEMGIDLNTVRQLAGHSDLSTTVRYDKRDEAWQRRASQSLQL